MNYNANTAARQQPTAGGGGMARKPKRVVDTNAMGVPMPMTQSYMNPEQFNQQPPQSMATGPSAPASGGYPQPGYSNNTNTGYNPNPTYVDYSQQQQHQQAGMANVYSQHPQQLPPNAPQMMMPGAGGQFAMFQQPIVQDMALQYGQKLADQGKELVNKEFEKYIPVTRLKYYFAVDNKYVLNKLRLLFFPFTHRDWSLKYDHENPVQPRYDINAPDLYIPSMAYITYVVLAGLVLGMQDRFSPEQLGIQASSALAYTIFELIVYSLTLYIANIQTLLKTLDLMAFAGYKYVIINACLLISILFKASGYYICLLYASVTLGFFLLRTIKAKVLSESTQSESDNNSVGYGYGQQGQQQYDHRTGHKRKVYFLLLVSGLQPVLSFWLSYHLIPKDVVVMTAGAAASGATTA